MLKYFSQVYRIVSPKVGPMCMDCLMVGSKLTVFIAMPALAPMAKSYRASPTWAPEGRTWRKKAAATATAFTTELHEIESCLMGKGTVLFLMRTDGSVRADFLGDAVLLAMDEHHALVHVSPVAFPGALKGNLALQQGDGKRLHVEVQAVFKDAGHHV